VSAGRAAYCQTWLRISSGRQAGYATTRVPSLRPRYARPSRSAAHYATRGEPFSAATDVAAGGRVAVGYHERNHPCTRVRNALPVSDHPLFSIVTVCLNAGADIAEAIESVLEQGCSDYEYLVVDGGSSDGTIGVLEEYDPRFGGRLHWVSEHDDGLYDAMNKGLALTRGDYVGFLGADDRLRPGALDAVARTLSTIPHPDIVCGATRVCGPTGTWDETPRRVVRRGLPARAPASHQSTFVRRETIVKAGGFDPRFRIAADYDLYLRLVEAGATETLVDDVLSDFRLGGVSSRDGRATARDYRDVRVAHGANPAVEELVMVRSAAATAAFALWMRVFHRAPGRVRKGSRG